MRPLMPTTAKGANVFRASVGHHTPAVLPDMEDDGEDGGEDEGGRDDDSIGEGDPVKSPIPWSRTPSLRGHSPTPPEDDSPPPSNFAPGHKRKHSALSAISSA